MKLEQASELAEIWIERFRPKCTRIEIAGSVLRGKPECNDIDVVCVPVIRDQEDMFGSATGYKVNELALLIEEEIREDNIRYAVDERGRLCNGQRQKKLMLHEGIKLELWLVLPPAQWGVIKTIRTGPSEFGHWLVTNKMAGGALPSDLKVKDGAVWKGTTILPTPEEKDFFSVIGLPWIEPSKRVAGWARW